LSTLPINPVTGYVGKYVLERIYQILKREAEERVAEKQTAKEIEEERNILLEDEKMKNLNQSTIELDYLITRYNKETDMNKKEILHKSILKYLDEYLPDEKDITKLIKHGFIYPEQIIKETNPEKLVEKYGMSMGSSSALEEKVSFDDLKHPPLQGIKDYSHDKILKFVKDNPAYSNIVLSQFIEGIFKGELSYEEFNKIKDYLRPTEQSQIVKVIKKDQVLKPNRFKKQVLPVILK